jgi:glutamate N-acetyltransferase / amino-acid N-acetyltransferase
MKLRTIKGGVTAAKGFKASGVSAGIKRSRKPDLSLTLADDLVTAAAVFTRNQVQAPPVHISRLRVGGGKARAVLINSGCANCMTGKPGFDDAYRLSKEVAELLDIDEKSILVASTGIIGRRLPVPRMLRAMPKLVKMLSRAGSRAAAQAILTTDIMPKEAAV